MKFSCGISLTEYIRRLAHEQLRLQQWHDFFALVPRTIGHKDGKNICCWLEIIERRGKLNSGTSWDGPWAEWTWKYREKEKDQ